MIATPEAVLDYWFGAPGTAREIAQRQSKLWFGKLPEKDREISERFTPTYNEAVEKRSFRILPHPSICINIAH